MTANALGTDPESDAALREIYGPKAVFSRVDRFTLVHLDAPSEELLAQRTRDFDPAEFFFDDCPLCQMAIGEGGHVVFDGDTTEATGAPSDPLREDYNLSNRSGEALPPAAAFDAALIDHTCEAENFAELFDDSLGEEVEGAYYEAVGGLSERLIDVLWSEESTRRVEHFDELVARARKAIDAVCAAGPHLADAAAGPRATLDRLAASWREL